MGCKGVHLFTHAPLLLFFFFFHFLDRNELFIFQSINTGVIINLFGSHRHFSSTQTLKTSRPYPTLIISKI